MSLKFPNSARPRTTCSKKSLARKNAAPAQVALAWVLAQHPSPAPQKLECIKENIAAAEIQLTPQDPARQQRRNGVFGYERMLI